VSRRVARLLGVLLIVYGLGGLVAAGLAYAMAQSSFGRVQALGESVQGEQPGMRQDLEQIAATIGDSATAAAGFADSLDRGRQSMATASQSANQLAASFDQAGQLGQVEVFGMRPFAPFAQSLGQSSGQFRTLATQLQQTSDAMGANVRDVQRVQGDLQDIRQRLEALAVQVQATSAGGSEVLRSLRGLELAVAAILLWLVIQSLGWLAAGIAILAYAGRAGHHTQGSGEPPPRAMHVPHE
jgi:hypothetical protein